MCDVVLYEHLGVGDVLARADKHEGHHALLARRHRLGLVVALHFHLEVVRDLALNEIGTFPSREDIYPYLVYLLKACGFCNNFCNSMLFLSDIIFLRLYNLHSLSTKHLLCR